MKNEGKAIRGIVLTVLLIGMLTLAVNVQPVAAVDWWPMFHHDTCHTGFSTSTAPNTSDTIWSYTTGRRVYSSPAVADSKVYVGSYDNKVYGFGPLPLPPPNIISTSPEQNELNVSVSTNISVTFDVDMDETTINDSTFVVNARSTGQHQGTITYNNQTKTATLDPGEDFDVGEVVTVVLTTDIQSTQGISLDSSYVWSFTTVVNNGTGTFAPHLDYPAGDYAYRVFAADLDGDSDLDLATANYLSPYVSVLMNNGDGIFAHDSDYPVGEWPLSVFAADLDGDGDLDLTTANIQSNNVSVLLNNGDGTFAPDSDYPVGYHPQSVFAADLDGDGDLDLTTANWYNFSILLNNGDGTFAPHSDSPTMYTTSVFAADLDGDGDLDLAIPQSGWDKVSVLLNIGDGAFAPDSDYSVGDHPLSVFAADLDGDGDLDLTTGNLTSEDVSILLNNGDGTFAPHSDYPVGGGAFSVFVADLDGDGDLDLTTANVNTPPSNNVSVLLNNGDGTFQQVVNYATDGSAGSVFAADLDGDGDLDLVTANFSSNNVSVLLNQAHDVAVINVVPSDTLVGQSDTTSINVTVENQGDFTETFDVTTYYDDTPIEMKPVTNLPPGEDSTMTFTWNTIGVAPDSYVISAYAHPVPYETDTDDNTYVDGMVRIVPCGDCNGDGVIELGDVVYLINYLYREGDPPEPVCLGDVNCDGVVELGDVVYLINYLYRQGDPPCQECCP